MTKEDLLNKARKLPEVSARGTDAYRDMLEFFESNVCIPKGETLQAKFDGDWTDVFTNNDEDEIRIKPSEPVCEWQWALVLNTIGEIGRTPFMTQQEFDKNVPAEQGIYWTLDIKTKRKRK